MTIAAGNTVTLAADQTNDITFDGNDAATGGTFTLSMKNDAADLTFADYETVSIATASAGYQHAQTTHPTSQQQLDRQ